MANSCERSYCYCDENEVFNSSKCVSRYLANCTCVCLCLYCMISVVFAGVVSFSWSTQSLLVQTSSFVIGHVWLWPCCMKPLVITEGFCLHEDWWLVKWIVVFVQILTNEFGATNSTRLLFLVCLPYRAERMSQRESTQLWTSGLTITQTDLCGKKKTSKKYIDLNMFQRKWGLDSFCPTQEEERVSKKSSEPTVGTSSKVLTAVVVYSYTSGV